MDNSFEPSEGAAYTAGDRSITFTAKTDRSNHGKALGVKTWMCMDEDFQVARAAEQSYNLSTLTLLSSRNLLYTKISKDEFEQGIEDTLDNINTVETLPFPMTKSCLGSGENFPIVLQIIQVIFLKDKYCSSSIVCPTEEDWCTKDPECSESLYQEPKAKIKAE